MRLHPEIWPNTECHRRKADNQNEENRCFHFEFRKIFDV